jgi:predicted ATPase
VLTELINPRQAPEVIAVREQVRSWRFYDHFRTDEPAPARQTQVGTRTPVLDTDGRDLMVLNEPETSLHPDLLPPLAAWSSPPASTLRSSSCLTHRC